MNELHLSRHGENGVQGLGGGNEPAVSPDGRHVSVAVEQDNSVSIFKRH